MHFGVERLRFPWLRDSTKVWHRKVHYPCQSRSLRSDRSSSARTVGTPPACPELQRLSRLRQCNQPEAWLRSPRACPGIDVFGPFRRHFAADRAPFPNRIARHSGYSRRISDRTHSRALSILQDDFDQFCLLPDDRPASVRDVFHVTPYLSDVRGIAYGWRPQDRNYPSPRVYPASATEMMGLKPALERFRLVSATIPCDRSVRMSFTPGGTRSTLPC